MHIHNSNHTRLQIVGLNGFVMDCTSDISRVDHLRPCESVIICACPATHSAQPHHYDTVLTMTLYLL